MGARAKRIEIRGLVQGVGFRPFVYRLATQYALSGWVDNRTDCVSILIEGPSSALDKFLEALPGYKPLPAIIHSIRAEDIPAVGLQGFSILASSDSGQEQGITEVSPDIAVCPECLADMDSQQHRLGYPFINCTNCGPRFTIIRDLPYDRDKTTMDIFPMCSRCSGEYHDILDRRFHAQPVACNHCGPAYSLHTSDGTVNELRLIISRMAEILRKGGQVAFKGMGGYNLACNALDENAVRRLREIKNREGKPFAVMFGSMEMASEYVHLDDFSRAELGSWRRPIVLLPSKKQLAPAVNNGFHSTGVMLPSLPIHHLLWRELDIPALVLTSGNISDEPIIISDTEALRVFGPLTDAVLANNREIHNRCDDSVEMVFRDHPVLIRRARGYAPSPIRLPFNVEGILATGAELVNCFAIGRGEQAILSQHQGDLKNFETYEFYQESIERFSRLFRFEAKLIATDLHPDYLSTRYGKAMGIKTIEIQHHHAHIASVMAEHGHMGPVLGISMDGTGLGTDGHIWGSEFMVCDFKGFERKSHFEYIPLPGGDKSVKEPWRIALSYLLHAFGEDGREIFRQLFPEIDPGRSKLIFQAIQQGINTPLSDSAGRLFDAVAALCGVCRISGFHAEAPMRLEAIATETKLPEYTVDAGDILSFKPMIREMVDELLEGRESAHISTRFHRTIAGVSARKALQIAAKEGLSTVALSGGVFQNRILLSLLTQKLEKMGFSVIYHRDVPSNDGGLALGQLAIAAHQNK